LTLDTMNLKN